MKLEFVKRHKNSVKHKNSLQILNSNQIGIKEGINQMLGMGMNKHPTSIVSDISLQVLRPPTLSQFKQQKTSRSNYATYTNKVSGHELL
ncbi:13707_t:CDS:2, partial [Funneliformis caledonium]